MDNVFNLTLVVFMLYASRTFCDIQKQMQTTFKRPDLSCPDFCNIEQTTIDQMRCCICQSFSVIKTADLSIKFVTKNNDTKAQIRPPKNHFDYHQLVHRNDNLTELPINICDFQTSLFYVDLSYNRIRTILNIGCLHTLDTLLLRGNQLETVDSKIINHLRFIRILDLSFNQIKWVSPGMTIDFNGNLFKVSMRFNNLTEVDITNWVMTNQEGFCAFDYSNNYIERIENRDNWVCSTNVSLGQGGMVDLSSNSMVEFVDEEYISYLGFKQVQLLGKLMFYGIDARNNMWSCDCKMVPAIQKIKFVIWIEDRDYFHVKCYSPQNLKGTDIIHLIKRNRFDLFICNLTMKDKCPPKCNCYYQPSVSNRTVVDCSNRNLTRLPSVLPDNSNLVVDLSGNRLTSIPISMEYLERIINLNVSHNRIGNISETVLFKLKDASLDLRGNNLHYVSRAFLMFSKCNILLDAAIDCKCSDAWMIHWLQNGTTGCTGNIKVYCNKNSRQIQFLDAEELGCKTIQNKSVHQLLNWLVVTMVILVVATSISVMFRYELFILARSALNVLKPRKNIYPFPVDFYIACNDEDPYIRSYMLNTLLPFCSANRYRPFLPCVHGEYGLPREEEIVDVMSKCNVYVIFLSLHYEGILKWNEKEWKYAWHNFTSDRSRKIIVVNYDMITAKDNIPKYIKAFLNLGLDIDFANRRKLLEKQIVSSIPVSMSFVGYDNQSEFCINENQDEYENITDHIDTFAILD